MTITARITNGENVGTIGTFKPQSDGSWRAECTAPTGSTFLMNPQYYNVEITATDEYGNTTIIDAGTWGTDCQLKVKELTPPTIEYKTLVNDGTTIIDDHCTLKAEAYDNITQTTGYSGIASLDLYVDGVMKTVTTTDIGNSGKKAECNVTDLSEGSHSYRWIATDNDGNVTEGAVIHFEVDLTDPEIVVNSPVNNFKTNQGKITVNASSADGDKYVISVNGVPTVDYANAKKITGGVINEEVTLTKGNNEIVIKVWDVNGRSNTVTITGIYSTTAPVFDRVVITPNPANANGGYTITVSVS